MGIGTLRRYHNFRGRDGKLVKGLTTADLKTNPTTSADMLAEPAVVSKPGSANSKQADRLSPEKGKK